MQEVTISSDGDGGHLLAFMSDGSFYSWELGAANGNAMPFHGHSKAVKAVDWNGSYLASGAADLTARIWDIRSGKNLVTLRGHESTNISGRGDVLAVRWQPKGRLLTIGEDGTLRIWQVLDDEGRPLCQGFDTGDMPYCYQHSHQLLANDSGIRSAAGWMMTPSRQRLVAVAGA
jgi:WD40 repeat protein